MQRMCKGDGLFCTALSYIQFHLASLAIGTRTQPQAEPSLKTVQKLLWLQRKQMHRSPSSRDIQQHFLGDTEASQ